MKNAKCFWRLLGYFLIPAIFFAFGGGSLRAQDTYTLVSDVSTLANGDEVIIVSDGIAFNGNIESNWGKGVPLNISNNSTSINVATTATDYEKSHAFIVGDVKATDKTFSLKGKVEGTYLYASADKKLEWSTSTQALKLETTGVTYSGRKLLYNNSSGMGFRFYGSSQSTGTSIKATELYKKESATTEPFVNTDKSEVSYKILPTANLNETLSFTAGNLTSGLTISVASADAEKAAVISVDKNTVEQTAESFDLTLTTSGLAEGTYSDIITIKMGETTMATVTVNLKVEMNYPYKKITTTDELTDEGKYLIVNETKTVALSTKGTGNFQTGAEVTIAEGSIEDRGTARELTLSKSGDKWKIYDADAKEYLYYTGSANELYAGTTQDTWTITFDGSGNATITNGSATSRVIKYNTSSPRFACYTSGQSDVQLFKKQVPEVPTCEKVTLPSDGAVTPHPTTADIIWVAPQKGEPVTSYEVTVTGEGYNETQTVTEGTEIEWTGLTAEKQYQCSIVSVCGTDFKSDPVEITFQTLAEAAPALNINTPAQGAIFTGDVTFTFTTTNFELGDDKLVKATVKEQAQDQVNAPILKTFYTKTSSVTITGLEDGKYHIDLYMVEVNGNDTAVVGFNGTNYVHRNIEVKHPAVYFSAKNLKITTYRGVEASGKVTVTGWALPENATINLSSNNAQFTVTPATLTKAEVMAEGGAEITVKYNGAEATATATITATCGDITATLAVNAIAKDTLANLKAVYSRAANDTVMVKGKMVVTHKDSYNNRIWVQDIVKENGASMLLYKAANGYADIQIGDVLENVAGTLSIYNDLYQFTPIVKLVAAEHGHSVYVDTLTADYINKNIATVQSSLVCVENVTFTPGTFATTNTAARTLTLNQGDVKLVFYTTYNDADYLNEATPTGRLNVTGIMGVFSGTAQITARNKADMVTAPCLVPANIIVEEVHSNEAILDWDGWADNYSLRYGTEENLESVTPVEVNGTHATIDNLNAQTTYYYQIKSVCGTDGYESDWSAVKSFTTVAANLPTIRMTSPALNTPTFTDSVLVSFSVRNVTLKANDTLARIVFSDGFTITTTDTAYKRALLSGNYSVRVELIKNNDTLTPNIRTQSRTFKVDLPNVADPVFTPAAGRYANSVEVTLDCATPGATIFYAQGEGEFTAYTAGSKIELTESAVLKAFACKDRMDTSATITAAYTIYTKLAPEGDLILNENFDGCGSSWTGNKPITNLDDYTTMPGWTGDKVYDGLNNVKLGTGSAKGILTTPSLNLSYDNGKYYVAFTVATWANNSEKTSIYLKAGDSTILVENIAKQPEMTEYVYLLDNGTADTKITFEAVEASNNRYYLDSIRVYQVLPNETMLIVTTACTMSTVQGTPVSSEITVKGKLLSENVAVNCPEGNFTVSPATLDKEEVMSEDGAKFTVTFNGSVASDNVNITLTSGELSETIAVTATATPVVEVENIAALRAGEQNTLYRVKGEVVITAMDSYRNYKWIQDATGAILIDDQPGYVTTTYQVGDGITGVYGKLGNYGGQLQLIMTGNLPEATSHDNTLELEVVTVDELTENIDKYCSRLVRINGLSLEEAEGNWEGNADNMAVDADGNSINIRTFVRNGNYVGEEKPQGRFNLIAIAGVYNDAAQVSPRTKEDIISVSGECEAPTDLEVIGGDCSMVTVTWKGYASEYKLVLLSKDGKDTLFTKMLTATQYTFGEEVKPSVEYGWAVASVCEDASLLWARGENFQMTLANEDAELQADVYPNPTDGVVYIRLAQNARMEIFTLGGVVIRSEMLNAGRNELRLDQSGIYFIRLSNGNAATVKRVVVR